MRAWTCALLLLIPALAGCAIKYMTTERTPYRLIHPGILIYDKSSDAITEAEWEYKIYLAGEAYQTLLACAGIPDDIARKMREIPIVIVPAEILPIPVQPGKTIMAFTDFDRIYIRIDYFDIPNLRHEWIHIYLYLSGKRIAGDQFHRDKLFKKCVYFIDY